MTEVETAFWQGAMHCNSRASRRAGKSILCLYTLDHSPFIAGRACRGPRMRGGGSRSGCVLGVYAGTSSFPCSTIRLHIERNQNVEHGKELVTACLSSVETCSRVRRRQRTPCFIQSTMVRKIFYKKGSFVFSENECVFLPGIKRKKRNRQTK